MVNPKLDTRPSAARAPSRRRVGQQGWLPYLLLTALFVSIGPLLYLVVNGRQPLKSDAGSACAAKRPGNS